MIENVYQHFRKEEQAFIDTVMGWVRSVEDQYTPYLTNFLDPRQLHIIKTIIGKNSDITVHSFGGYEAAERVRAFICPAYFTPKQDDFEIAICEIRYPIKFASLSHGKVLGTLISTGLKRDYFGDIISDGTRWQVFVENTTKSYVEQQVISIGKVSVRLEERKYTDILIPIDNWSIESQTVSSMRLDTLVSSVFNISRQRAKQMIDSGKVKLNWVELNRPDFEIGLLDIVSVRGYGRFQVQEIEGKTKKDKWRLQLGVLHK